MKTVSICFTQLSFHYVKRWSNVPNEKLTVSQSFHDLKMAFLQHDFNSSPKLKTKHNLSPNMNPDLDMMDNESNAKTERYWNMFFGHIF